MKPAIITQTSSAANFTKNIFAGDSQFTKEAADLSSLFIRDYVREKGFARKVTPPVTVSESDLVPTEHTDEPAIMVNRDVDARAMVVPLRGQGEYRYIETDRYLVYFQKLVSEKIRKSKKEMMTLTVDYKKIMKDRIGEAMFEVEDQTMVSGFNRVISDIIAEETADGSIVDTADITKATQYIDFKNQTLNKSTIKQVVQMAWANRIEPEKFLMTEILKQEIIEMSMLEVGDDNVSKYWKEGVKNVGSFWGLDIVTTIKNHLVKENELFLTAVPDLLGNFFILQDHTMYFETERDIFTMDSEAYNAFTIGNTKGVYKAKFNL